MPPPLPPPPLGRKADRQVPLMDHRPPDRLRHGDAELPGQLPGSSPGLIVEEQGGAVRHTIWRLARPPGISPSPRLRRRGERSDFLPSNVNSRLFLALG